MFRREPLRWFPVEGSEGGFKATARWGRGTDRAEHEFRLEPYLVLAPQRFGGHEPDVGWTLRLGDDYFSSWRRGLLDDYESSLYSVTAVIRLAELCRFEQEIDHWCHGWRRPFWWVIKSLAWNRHAAWLDRHFPEPDEPGILARRVPAPQRAAARWERMLDAEATARLIAQGETPAKID